MPISPFALCVTVIVFLSVLGLPIGHSMIVATTIYLLVSGLDLGTAAEQILNGLFNSYVLIAIPLFILAADLMNVGSLTDKLLRFCLVLVGRFRGGLGHVNVVANMIFAGMSGSAIAILDSLKMFPGPIIELHISNIHKREPIYHNSLVSKVATGVMAGFGAEGYRLAMRAILAMIAKAK
jgi:TRAP-type mannitol/chloroaromatic compound transport system permease large subunit